MYAFIKNASLKPTIAVSPNEQHNVAVQSNGTTSAKKEIASVKKNTFTDAPALHKTVVNRPIAIDPFAGSSSAIPRPPLATSKAKKLVLFFALFLKHSNMLKKCYEAINEGARKVLSQECAKIGVTGVAKELGITLHKVHSLYSNVVANVQQSKAPLDNQGKKFTEVNSATSIISNSLLEITIVEDGMDSLMVHDLTKRDSPLLTKRQATCVAKAGLINVAQMLEERPLECWEQKMDWYRTADRFFNKNGFGTTMLKILEEARQESHRNSCYLPAQSSSSSKQHCSRYKKRRTSTKDMSPCQGCSKENRALGH